MIATLRQEGFSAAILHPVPKERHKARNRLIDDLLDCAPKIAGFTAHDQYLPQLFSFIRDARERGLKSHITLGGICASAIPEDILRYNRDVDSVVCGEGELSIVELANTVVKGGSIAIKGVYIRKGNEIVFGGMRPLIDDLDALPSPVLDNFIQEGYDPFTGGDAFFIASRGCYGKCSFCSLQKYYRSCEGKVWRARHPNKIVREITEYAKTYMPRRMTFADENFMGPGRFGRQHALDVVNALKANDINIPFNFACRPNDLRREELLAMKKANLAAVTLGIESMSDETLRLFNKGTTAEINEKAIKMVEELELYLEITFIFFHPLASLDDIRKNLQLVEYVNKSRFAYFNRNMPFNEYYPFFNTEYTQKLTEMKLVKRTLRSCKIRYRDPKVGFIAGKINAVPLEQLASLTHAVRSYDPNLQEVAQTLKDYAYYLNMIRIPELVSDCCDYFSSGGSPASGRMKIIENEFDKETRKIHSLYSQII